MSFQAPFSITDMRRLQMAEAMQEQQQMQNNQQMVLNGLMHTATTKTLKTNSWVATTSCRRRT